MAGRLSTHVLDIAAGQPARGMGFELRRIAADGTATVLFRGATDADGRNPAPLLEGEAYQPGTYELVYDVAAYFRAKGIALPDPPFLDRVPIRFGLAASERHYHVPFQVTPWSYATYRGS